jgi:hypothetical protein
MKPYIKRANVYFAGLEPVLGTSSGTLKNLRFCRVPRTGSGWNPKFEKRFQNRFLVILNFEKSSGLCYFVLKTIFTAILTFIRLR